MDNALKLLKLDLGISTSAYDESLTAYLKRSQAAIERQGITLPTEETDEGTALTIESTMLVVQYAAFLWRGRKGEDRRMPASLRFDLNNLYIQQNGNGTEG